MDKTLRRLTPDEYTAWRPSREYLAHYITFRPNMLDAATCDTLARAFDEHPELQVERAQGDHFRFMQTDVTEHSGKEPWKSCHEKVVTALGEGLSCYAKDLDYAGVGGAAVFPERMAFERVRINRTANNGKDGFGNHVDVDTYVSARRFLTLLFYLSDVEVGGDAAFPTLGFSVKPTKGALLCFPSNWIYLHCGIKPLSHPKYIMTSFGHYL